MSINGSVALTQQEALARDIIGQRVAAHHHAPRHDSTRPVRRQVRAALLLRSLAERLDPSSDRQRTSRPDAAQSPTRTRSHDMAEPHAGSPRPWAPERRAAHRHT